MADTRKRISKKASKILFEIICEDSFEGHPIKVLLPATRRVAKGKEELWDYIRTELIRRSEESYDLSTVTAAWYYNLRKIGSCLDQIEMGDGNVAMNKMHTLGRYVCNNMGDRVRGRGKGGKEGNRDVKLTAHQLLSLSRQSTMVVNGDYSPEGAGPYMPNAQKETKMEDFSEEEEENIDDDEMVDIGSIENDMHEPIDIMEAPRMEANHSTLSLNDPSGEVELRIDDQPRLSRYNTAETSPISRNNSTMSVSGYDADNEKGLIKRRRKELRKKGGDKEKEVKIEETLEETEEKKEEEEEEDKVDDAMEEERDEGENEVETSEKKKMVDNLKGMIENLRDHCLSLRIMGVIDAIHMETLADSFENAGKSIMNNMDTR